MRPGEKVPQSIGQAHAQPVEEAGVRDYEEITRHGIRAHIDGRTVLAGNDWRLHRENIPHDVHGRRGRVSDCQS